MTVKQTPTALAEFHCIFWHLFYGMWKGYSETRTYDDTGPIALTSTDDDYHVVKVFWERK